MVLIGKDHDPLEAGSYFPGGGRGRGEGGSLLPVPLRANGTVGWDGKVQSLYLPVLQYVFCCCSLSTS